MKSNKRKTRKVVAARVTSGKGSPVAIVGVGASAGGLEAFTKLLKHLPPDTGLGIVLVQHLDPQHDSALVPLLARTTSMPVREVTHNLLVEANQVYVIPPNTNLSVTQGRLKLHPRSQIAHMPQAIDIFFQSLAQDQHERAIGVVLSGTASDGTLGLEAIKAEGGITFAQDESAKYDSMPRSAVAAGCVDSVLSPEHIASELARIIKHPHVAGRTLLLPAPAGRQRESETGGETPGASPSPSPDGMSGEKNGFKRILLLIRQHSGVDFSCYKPSTIHRRITRRMVLRKLDKLERYTTFLRSNASELDTLYSDLLISVTSFFRNPEVFDALQRQVFPKLLRQRNNDPVRIWVPGCSTGQEAYSIAMAFMESADHVPNLRKLQIFATDLNDALLDKARHGLYAKTLLQGLSPKRLRRFFVEEDGGYRATKVLRDTVIFARQNLFVDPPFSRMDLISCRNLLIYLETNVQKKVFPTLHYALKPEGFLLLGASESIGGFTELFEPVTKKHKLYYKKTAPTPAVYLPVDSTLAARARALAGRPPVSESLAMARGKGKGHTGEGATASEDVRSELNAQREADRVTVNQFAPPGVLVNADLQILQFRGPTSAYLVPPTGKASFNVLKMARAGLLLPLRAAINKAKKENISACTDNVQVQQNGTTRTVSVRVIPLKHVQERCFLILFEDAERIGYAAAAPAQQQPARTRRPLGAKNESRRVADLEKELADTRDYLQSIQESHEAANEELQASNEEAQSANEELQSLNEELATSKEELESTNEELTTLNEEIANRNAELARSNSDLLNLQTSIKLAIVGLTRDLTIRSFTPQAESLFNLLATDVGRPIGNVRHNLVFEKHGSQDAPPLDPLKQEGKPVQSGRRDEHQVGLPSNLETIVGEVLASLHEQQHEVRDTTGRWYLLRVHPYFTLDRTVDGALLMLIDITAGKQTEEALKESTARLARDTAALIRLNAASTRLWTIRDLREGLDEMLAATIALLGADRGNLQLLDADRGVLSIAVQRGFKQDFLDFFRAVSIRDDSACGRALQSGQRTVIEDVETDALYAPYRAVAQAADYRGVQSTPLIGPNGTLLGILSTHWRLPHQPSQQDLHRLDLYARQAANFIEHCRVRQILASSEEQFKALFNQTSGGIALTDVRGRFTAVNDRYCTIVGRSRQELLTLRLHDITHPDDLPASAEQFHTLVQGGASLVVERRYLRPDGSTVWVHKDLAALRDNQGQVSHIIAAIVDITDRKRADEALARLAAIVTSSSDAIIGGTLHGVITSWNTAAERLYGYSAEEVIGRSLTILTPSNQPDEDPAILDQITHDKPIEHFETTRRRKDGSLVDISLTISPVKDTIGLVVGLSAIARDLTEHKHLREKDVLLKEVHHRVKNNLQIVSTLLGLQSEHLQDPHGVEMFKESQGRVKSIALIHERLYRSQDLAHVNVTEYIRQLADDLYHTYKVSSEQILLDVGVDLPPLSINNAIPCGLLLNELMSNCLKHAFTDAARGSIRVSFTRDDTGRNILTVADDGVGFPHSLDFRHTTSFGMQLVNTLVEQLHGEIILTSNRLPNNRGTAFTITFPGT